MTQRELEDAIYEYGEVMKHIGKSETNEKSSTKEYNKLIAEKEKLIAKFDFFFGVKTKAMKSLGVA